WRYEIDENTGDLTINGVVLNEMKGVFSNPDEIFSRNIFDSLYPDTEYGFEIGGDPEVIPELSYEEFLDFHRRYYHPSNSYIYLYGNMDMAEKLDFIDREYLSKYDRLEIDSMVKSQKAFDAPRKMTIPCPINDDEDEIENTYASLNYAFPEGTDPETYVAMEILDYALCSAPGAYVYQKLMDKGLGNEIYSDYENGIKQPFFSFVSRGIERERFGEFEAAVKEALTDIVNNGFDKKALLAGINTFEFKFKEADSGRTPVGLIYGIQMLDSWLYNEDAVFDLLEINNVFESLKKKVDTGYFEGLVKKHFLENSHATLLTMIPEKGLQTKKDEEERVRLEKLKASMKAEELESIREKCEALKVWQETPDSEEALGRIPQLKLSDLEKKAEKLTNQVVEHEGVKILFHDLFTKKIGYIRLIFSIDEIPLEYLKYLGIFKGCFSVMDTKNYKYADLNNEINLKTGGIYPVTNMYNSCVKKDEYKLTFEIKLKAFYENIHDAFEFVKELILNTKYDDGKRLREIISEGKSTLQGQMMQSSHSVALHRSASYVNRHSKINEIINGVDFYEFVSDLDEHFDEKKEEIVAALITLVKMIFREENLMFDFIGDREGLEILEKEIASVKKYLFTEEVKKERYVPELKILNEGLTTSGRVQFVCRGGMFIDDLKDYKGSLKVLNNVLTYGYLHESVRVKGGAYGCFGGFSRNGYGFFISYRDPNLKGTVDVFEKVPEAVENLELNEKQLEGFVISTTGDLDKPMTPSLKGLTDLTAYMQGLTDEMLQKERDEILNTSLEDLRGLSKYMKAILDNNIICVVGNIDAINREKNLFGTIRNLV
ncbi:MAG: insulinase family protein, partial [Lachnospiraceae bacterium]|nr:insulinase family protein [Lachnospiraceae bacterium]